MIKVERRTSILEPPIFYKDEPMELLCKNCKRFVTSRVEYKRGLLTWVLVFILLFMG